MSIRYKEGERKERKKGRKGGANSESTHLLQLLWPCIDDLHLEMYYKLLVVLGTCRFLLQAGWRRRSEQKFAHENSDSLQS
jgi:hypothetical protein